MNKKWKWLRMTIARALNANEEQRKYEITAFLAIATVDRKERGLFVIFVLPLYLNCNEFAKLKRHKPTTRPSTPTQVLQAELLLPLYCLPLSVCIAKPIKTLRITPLFSDSGLPVYIEEDGSMVTRN